MFKKITSKLASLNVRSWGGKIATSVLMMVVMAMVAQSAQANGTKQSYTNTAGHSWNKVVTVDWNTQKIVVICNKSTLTNPSTSVFQLIGVCPNNTSDSNYKIDWAGKGCTMVYRNNIMYSWDANGGNIKNATPNASLWNSDVYTFEFIKGEGVKFNGTTILNATNAHTSLWTESMKVGSESGTACGGEFTIKVVSMSATDAEITSVIPAGERIESVKDEFDNSSNGGTGWNVTANNIDWTTEKFVMSINDNGFAQGKEVFGFNVPGASNDSENGDIGWGRKKSICMTCSSTTGLKIESFNNTLWSVAYSKTIQNANHKYLIEISSDGVYVNGQVAIPSTNTQFAEMLTHNSLKFGCTNNLVGYHSDYFRRVNKVAVDDASKTIYQGRTINTPTEQLNVNVQLQRTLDNTAWNTFCVPFNIDAATITSKFGEGTQLRTYGSMEGTTMNFVEATSIEAGKPYLIKPGNASVENPTFEGVDIVAGDPQTVGDGTYSMVGTYGLTTLATDGTNLFLGDGNKFYKPESESAATMNGMRAYFVVPAGTNQAALVANIDGTFTSINQIDGAKVVENAPVYNLNGQRVGYSLQGLGRGIYVQNGKKYVVK